MSRKIGIWLPFSSAVCDQVSFDCWQVINGIKREGVGSECFKATSAIGDDVIESDDAIDVRVWREGVGAITVIGNEAASC